MGQILFEKAHTLLTSPHDLFIFLHPKHLIITITHHYVLSLSKPYANTSNPNNGQETKPTPTVQITPHFTKNPPPTSSKDGSHVQITRPTLVTILATQVTMKDKEPRAHVDTTTKA